MTVSLSNVNSYADISTSTDTAASSSKDLGEDAFLRLLVTQMQYQDPLEPQSNEEFVARERVINSRCLLVNKKEEEGS